MDSKITSNAVVLIGEVVSEFTFSHKVCGEGFYTITLAVKRLSEEVDLLPVLVSDRLLDVTCDHRGLILQVIGQYRSYNGVKDGRRYLALQVFAKEIYFLRPDLVNARKSNNITLKGFVCKTPNFRETPLGREITDLLIGVNRDYGKSDYIPCVTWGRNARYAADFEVGAAVDITGRIQSREYQKRLNEYAVETRVAYEVSVSKINCAERSI